MTTAETTTIHGRHREATRRPGWLWPALATLAVVALLAVLSACGETPATVEPATAETVTAEPVVETVTETVEVEVTPEICVHAIELAETLRMDLADISLELLRDVQDILVADGYMITTEFTQIVEDSTAKVEALDRTEHDSAILACTLLAEG
jgi:hypothetical protein